VENIPAIIKEKIESIENEVVKVIQTAEKIQLTKISAPFNITYENAAPRDILTDDERAQSICFITRYESLPIADQIEIGELEGKYYLTNIDYIKHTLNEYRSIIQNKSDSIYYQKIHSFCRQKMVERDMSQDLVITIINNEEGDITDKFTKFLDERCKSIRTIIDNLEFGFIYNGILQHSDHRYTKRYLNEYVSGDLNYVFLKHAKVLETIKEWLNWHYRIMNTITFPKMGPL